MDIFYKIIAAILLFASVLYAFFTGASLSIEGKNIFSPYIDTQFAPQYSPEKFELIKIGQTIEEVEEILGQPLNKYRDSSNIAEYWYTNDGKLYSSKKSGDFAWYRSVIYFDNEGKVINIDKGWNYD
jgi:outer membrane protein assembly factor BamE (lipoprotein component of BamABCDE complex)